MNKHAFKWVVLGSLLVSGAARADEGMWLYNQPPLQALKERYGFQPPAGWLDHLMKSSVRFNSGGSGSFVSSDGLVMTNHHVAADAIQKLSGPGKDLISQGYIARTRQEELPCVDLELNVLQSIEDVTPRIQGAVTPGMDTGQAERARRAAINTLEQEESKKTGLRADVVTLFRGGAYHLYRYKRYTDVRLVFAPEIGIAFYGGDTDNFEYPRHCLDVTFLRVYENGQPVKPEHFLQWSPAGSKEGDLVFVSGHPGRTNRLNTASHLRFFRDTQYPFTLNYLRRLEVLLNTYGERSAENYRQSQDERFGVQNSRKARLGGLQGLQDPGMLARKLAAEDALRQRIQADPALNAQYAPAWAQVDAAVRELAALYPRYAALEQARAFNSELFHKARVLVRRAAENQKPNAQRLREYAESGRESLEQDLFSTAPLYPAFEEAKLADSLSLMMEMLGAEDPLVRKVLGGKSPVERARELVGGSRLADVAYRKQIAGLTPEQLRGTSDPMIDLALLVDAEARTLRDSYEKKVAEPLEQAYAKIAQATLAASGNQPLYPDATFTLRLSYGKVAGYREGAQQVPANTNFAGLYAKEAAHGGQRPFNLPARWKAAQNKLNLKTPFNFVTTNDIIGGNSGSPVVDRNNQVVGLIFDGNLQSLVLDFAFSEEQARALAVDSRAITEALRKVYNFPALADELTRGSK
jgi:hypothetical protein